MSATSPRYLLCWVIAHTGNPDSEDPGHPLKPIKFKKDVKTSKRVEPFRTPEGKHFREELSKLDPWIYHKRLTEYFKKDENEPSNPGNPSQYMRRGQTLPARQMWLLEEMCLRAGIDTMMIDPTLTYWENKAEIERELHTKLHLTYSGEKAEEAREMAALLSDELKEQAAALADYMRSRGKNH